MLSELAASNQEPDPLEKQDNLNDSVQFLKQDNKEEVLKKQGNLDDVQVLEQDKEEGTVPKNVGSLIKKIHKPKVSLMGLVNKQHYVETMEAILRNLQSKRQENHFEAVRQCQEIEKSLRFELPDDVDYSNATVCPYSPSVLKACCPGYLEEFVPLKSSADGNCLYSSVCIALQVSWFHSTLLKFII